MEPFFRKSIFDTLGYTLYIIINFTLSQSALATDKTISNLGSYQENFVILIQLVNINRSLLVSDSIIRSSPLTISCLFLDLSSYPTPGSGLFYRNPVINLSGSTPKLTPS
ncbi:hypothetical protein O181_104650 [Austropuccinia psidii MF-1]|uniref:Uncharacterized protein n=1 Tax=Austropuccinia psidii MF-1 TaxID=1389203 RepID=A0A9Q3PKW8_9BASI|nr:hypothetical protein [Austropuccinia psidii MF-1]